MHSKNLKTRKDTFRNIAEKHGHMVVSYQIYRKKKKKNYIQFIISKRHASLFENEKKEKNAQPYTGIKYSYTGGGGNPIQITIGDVEANCANVT